MGCFVSTIENEMPAREFLEWQAYYRLEPFGQDRDNWHAAQIAHILANANRKSSSAPISMAEFMYVDEQTAREKQEQSVLKWFERMSDGGN